MAIDSLILISNPNSKSRRYALFKKKRLLANLNFEYDNGSVVCTITGPDVKEKKYLKINNLSESISCLQAIFKEYSLVKENQQISKIGISVTAPGHFFLENRFLDDKTIQELNNSLHIFPTQARFTSDEIHAIKNQFPELPVICISNTKFHSTKPDHAWNYGIDIHLADNLGIKRYGYNGISVASIVRQLHYDLPEKLIVCYLDEDSSVTAVYQGRSIDNSMGYSPLEGLASPTRSGSIDITAAIAVKKSMNLDDQGLEDYLNNESGLLGLSGSSDDVSYLIDQASTGDPLANLALNTYAYNVKKYIGQMIAVLNGIDTLVFTGNIGAKSGYMRSLILSGLDDMGIAIDHKRNDKCLDPSSPIVISLRTRVAQVIVVPAFEESEIMEEVINFK